MSANHPQLCTCLACSHGFSPSCEQTAIEAVRALHKASYGFCLGCGEDWPCRTERAIRTALGE